MKERKYNIYVDGKLMMCCNSSWMARLLKLKGYNVVDSI